jgi:hypothetical protein
MDSHGNGSIQGRILVGELARRGDTSRRHSHKSIHATNEEGQTKICEKLKEFLNIRLVIT